jgi:hypothetical protein
MRWPLPLQSYRRVSSERLVNCYPQSKPQDAYGGIAIVRAPGIAQIAEFGASGRGLKTFDNTLYAIAGSNLIRVDGTSSATNVAVVPGSGRVKMVAMAQDLVLLTTAGDIHVWDGTEITSIDSPWFGRAGDIEFLDNLLIGTVADTMQLFTSYVNDPYTYDPLYFASAEFQPDPLVGVIADHGQAFYAGTMTCELWQGRTGAGFPLERAANFAVQLGCAAGRSLASQDNAPFWLANDLTVRRLSGFTPTRVSTDGVEDAIRNYGDVSDAFALAYSVGGHLMYALTFPGRATWEFDITTSQWHERKSYGRNDWGVVAVEQFGNDVYTLDAAGRLGVMRANVYEECGDTQRVEFVTSTIYAENDLLRQHEAELVMRTGSA